MEGRWIAHVPDLPGCFNTHSDREAAISGIPNAIDDYTEWCGRHGLHISGLSGPMIVSEVIRAWNYEEDYEVNAFFASDRPPLMQEEIAEYQQLLSASRGELQQVLNAISPEDYDVEYPGEDRTIRGILHHIADAERWYMDRLGLAPPNEDLPTDVEKRLSVVREHLIANLPTLVRRSGVVTMSGEGWSSRKVLRRALWHERDHTLHIMKIRR
jgi:uncharacterized damage-inducible protein DinB/predicted RNase H-like HicB family nuclease